MSLTMRSFTSRVFRVRSSLCHAHFPFYRLFSLSRCVLREPHLDSSQGKRGGELWTYSGSFGGVCIRSANHFGDFTFFGGVGIVVLWLITGWLLLEVGKLPQLRPVVYIVGLIIVWIYWAVATVGVWRSASLYPGDARFKPIAAKYIVVLIAGSYLFRLVNGGALILIGRTMSSWNWSLIGSC